jgi:hypothetical protein
LYGLKGLRGGRIKKRSGEIMVKEKRVEAMKDGLRYSLSVEEISS